MADIRINALAGTATSSASDDYLAIDGAANGTRKLSAYSPTFGGNLTVSGTGSSSVGGNLGIGTTTPSKSGGARTAVTLNAATGQLSILELCLNETLQAYAYASATQFTFSAQPSRFMSFETGNTEQMRLTSTGNLLLGTTTDAGAKLQVSGTASISSTLTLGGSVTTIGATNGYAWWKDTTPTKAWGMGSNGFAGMSGGDGSFILGTYNGAWNKALEIDTTGLNATFAGTITASNTILSNKSLWSSGYTTVPSDSVSRAILGVSGGVAYLQSLTGGTTNALSVDANNITFRTATYTTALTLDSSQNATFAGNGLFSTGGVTVLEAKSTSTDAQQIVNAGTGAAASTIYKINGSLVAQQYVTSASGYQIYGPSSFLAYTLNPTNGNATFAGTIKPQQAATASAPTYVKGAIYFDTTLNKLRVGGATGWETITSV